MFRKPTLNKFTSSIRVLIPEDALDVIFDECDRFDSDETGGRIIGFYEDKDAALTLRITGIIEAGPKASRSPTSLFQDGDYQEPIFRSIESEFPAVEHLGTWHTHHVNGLQTLSGGDITTYRKTVNHPNQHTPFFYALLVVSKNRTGSRLDRYAIKHFLFRPNDDRSYEIPESKVSIIDDHLMWPRPSAGQTANRLPGMQNADSDAVQESVRNEYESASSRNDLIYDHSFISEFFPEIKTFKSEQLGIYWKGRIDLADASSVELVITEDASRNPKTYAVFLREPSEGLATAVQGLTEREFPSPRFALIHAERTCNRALLAHASNERGRKLSRK